MNREVALLQMKSDFETLYEDVKLIESGPASFVAIGKDARGAVISVASDDKSWFVELWAATNSPTGEEECVEEVVIERRDDAIRKICAWLDR